MFKRPDHLPLGVLNGHNSLVAGSYKHSLGEYVAALKQTPDDPLLNLLIAVTFIHMASQKFATKRHSLVVQVSLSRRLSVGFVRRVGLVRRVGFVRRVGLVRRVGFVRRGIPSGLFVAV